MSLVGYDLGSWHFHGDILLCIALYPLFVFFFFRVCVSECFFVAVVFFFVFFFFGGGWGGVHYILVLLCNTFCPSRFVIISLGNRELVVYIVFLVSWGCNCSMPLLHSVKGWSAMYDCDFLVILIFWFYCSYSSLNLAAPIRLEVSSWFHDIDLRPWKGGPSIPYPFNYFKKYPIPKIQEALYPHIPRIDPSIPYSFKYMTWDFQQCGMCDQQILRSGCTYAQSYKSLC